MLLTKAHLAHSVQNIQYKTAKNLQITSYISTKLNKLFPSKRRENYGGIWVTAALILKFGTIWKSVVCFALRPLSPGEETRINFMKHEFIFTRAGTLIVATIYLQTDTK